MGTEEFYCWGIMSRIKGRSQLETDRRSEDRIKRRASLCSSSDGKDLALAEVNLPTKLQPRRGGPGLFLPQSGSLALDFVDTGLGLGYLQESWAFFFFFFSWPKYFLVCLLQ